MNEEPIFLVGAERSGTTLLRLMLDHHPQIAWCNEFEYSVDRIPEGDEWPSLEEYSEWLETHRIFQGTGFKIDRSLSYPQLIESFLNQRCDRAGKPIVGATVHRHFDRLLRIWQNARFVHIVRDGRDVARSCIGMGWAGNVWTGVERWIEAEHLWQKVASKVSEERRFEVRYESLITNPVETLKDLCGFIGVPYDEAMLSYPQTTVYDLPDAKLVYQWRRKLSEREIQLVESRISHMLLERGYTPSGLPRIEVNTFTKRQLRLQDWWARVRFRIERYGFSFFVADYLSRRLGLKQWQKQVKLEFIEIIKARREEKMRLKAEQRSK